MDSYQKLNEYLAKGKNKNDRPSGKNNTRIVRTSKHSIGIKLHNTVIMDYFEDGKIRLNTGGWKTITTRERMNYWQNEFDVYQMKFIWYLEYRGLIYLFKDNMILYPSGRVELNGELVKPMSSDDEKKQKKLKAKVDKYCNTFIDLFAKQKIDKPSGGDCWLCCLKDKTGKTWGDNDASHILGHIDEKYYVPSLLHNAIQENEGNGVYGLAPVDKHNIAWGFKYEGWETNPPWALDITKKRLKMILKRYVNKRLGLGMT